MHPDTGSYLGFATIRYRDSKRPDRPPVTAIDAARKAVRTRGLKVGADMVRVEYDPEGRRSRRMLEEHLRRDRQKQEQARQAQAIASVPKGPPTGPKSTTAAGFVRPPPTAPKGPAAQRQASAPGQPPPTVPTRPRAHPGAVEGPSLSTQLANDPYIFVPMPARRPSGVAGR